MMKAPLSLFKTKVKPEWIDYNGHVNDTEYMRVFSLTLDAFLDYVDIGVAYVKRAKCGVYTAEGHLSYLREIKADADLICTTQLLGFDTKRFRLFNQLGVFKVS